MLRAGASYHDARFTDYLADEGGALTQLGGNRRELSPYQLGSLGLLYAPAKGFTGSVEASYVGSSYLDRGNSFTTGGYTTLAASAGYRFDRWDFRVKGENLTDKRNPVAASEMGEGEYYLLPGRRVDATLRFRF